MKIKSIIIIAIFLGWSALSLQGQNPMALYYMETIPQSSQINPAMQPRANGFFSLPSPNIVFQSDLAFNDLFQEQGNEWVTPLSQRFNYKDLYKASGKSASLINDVNVDLLGLGFRSGPNYFTFTASLKNVIHLGVPSDLFKIAEEGFPDGQSFDFSSTRMKQAAYHELAFGYSREWDERFTFGIKVKPLFGIAGGVTDINSFQLNTSREQWDMVVDGTVYASAPLDVAEGEPGEFPESIEGKDLSSDETLDYITSLKNGGMAFDFGALYEMDENWSFSAAFNNLGFVGFKNDLNSLSFNGTYSFDGLSTDGGLDEDQVDKAIDDITDSVKSVIKYDVAHEKFSVPLASSLYAGASYKWTPSVSFGFLSRSVFRKYNFRQDFSLSANIQPYSFVALNLNYSKRVNGGDGLGTALTVLAGPLQLFLAADYIPTRFANVSFDGGDSVSLPYRQKDLNFRFGLNLIFGRHGHRDEPMLSLN